MPPRLNILEKRWSTFDLPILPFLAPSIFEPWPSYTRQNFQQRRGLQKRAGNAKRDKYDSPKKQGRLSHRKPILMLEAEDEAFNAKYKEIWSAILDEESQSAADVIDSPKQSKPHQLHFVMNPSRHTDESKGLSYRSSRSRAQEAWLEERKHRQALRRKNIQARVRREVVWLGIPRPRPRYFSLPLKRRYKFAWTVGEWNRRFVVLNLHCEKFMEGKPAPKRVIYHTRRPSSHIPQGFKQAFIGHASTSFFRQLWEDLDRRTRTNLWPEIMMTALELYPDASLNFLEATYQHPHPPAFAVSNCLEFIISNRCSGPPPANPKINDKFVAKIRALLYLGAQERVFLSQDSIFRLVCHSSMPTITRLYVTLRQLKHQLHENTLLQFASNLGKKGSIGARRALKVLEQMREQGTSMNTVKTLSVLSAILDRDDRDSDSREVDSKVLLFMMESGASPNTITYNILLKNSLRDGEPGTGWKIYQMMRDNGIEPNCSTYSILLNDSKRRMDAERMREIVSVVKDKGLQDPYIITDVLHAIFLLQRNQAKYTSSREQDRQSPKMPAFGRMFKVYSEYFHTQPLQTLIPAVAAGEVPQSAGQLHHPGIPTIVVMITAYLAELRTLSSIRTFYDQFLALLAAGNTTASDVAKTSHVWVVIIMNFSRFDDTLSNCLEVMGYMMQHMTEKRKEGDATEIEADPLQPEFAASFDDNRKFSPPELNQTPSSLTETTEPSETNVTRQGTLPAPNVHTWSVLLEIFMNHKQPRAAEKVLEMMQEHGIKPNMVTWNSLIVGYSKMQATLDAVDAVRRMEEAGFRPDDFTLTALARLNDKRTMMLAMQRYEQLKATQQRENTDVKAEEDDEESDEMIRQWDRAGEELD